MKYLATTSQCVRMTDPKVFQLLQEAHSALFRAADQALRERSGLTASQQGVLFVLMKKDGVPISTIAEALKMGKSSLTGLIDRMAEKGLVRRRPSASDARSILIFLEDPGRRLVQETAPATKQINAALLEPFSPDERALVARFLRHVSTHAATIVTTQAKTAITQRTGS